MNVPDATSLVALLQQEVPRAVFEAAPSVDLQATIYVPREHLPVGSTGIAHGRVDIGGDGRHLYFGRSCFGGAVIRTLIRQKHHTP